MSPIHIATIVILCTIGIWCAVFNLLIIPEGKRAVDAYIGWTAFMIFLLLISR